MRHAEPDELGGSSSPQDGPYGQSTADVLSEGDSYVTGLQAPAWPPTAAVASLFDRAREARADEVRRDATGIGLEIRKRREVAARDLVRMLGDDVAAVDLVDLDGWVLDRSWTWGPATYALGPLSVVHEAMPGSNGGELYAIAYRGRSIGPSPLVQLADVGRVLDDVADRIDAELDAGPGFYDDPAAPGNDR